MKGIFITFEGGDGTGKSTQARRLADRLKTCHLSIVSTREPGGTPQAEMLRDLILSGDLRRMGPMAEAIAFAAARADHVDSLIRPALLRGCWVICDRFLDSTRAYQGVAGGLDASFIARLEQVSVGETRPDITFILDMDPEESFRRAEHRRGAAKPDRFEGETRTVHMTLREAFQNIARAEPERCVLLHAEEDEERIAQRIWDVVCAKWRGYFPSAS